MKIKQNYKKSFLLPRRLMVLLIKLYQKILSPDHSFWAKRVRPHGYCKYFPTCSEYSSQVIKKRGILIGIPKIIWRVLRCNPWSRGGIDLPE
ncbi:MAG: membrane protein insertion efficiency factor YidD [Patescibacteria group bacterium]